jgi:hypothetical protein
MLAAGGPPFSRPTLPMLHGSGQYCEVAKPDLAPSLAENDSIASLAVRPGSSGWMVPWAVRYCPTVKTALRISGLVCLAVSTVWILLGLRASGWNLRGAWRSVQVMFDGPKKDLPPGAFDMAKPLYLVAIGVSLLSLAS